MNPITKFLFELQEVSLLLWGVVTGFFRKQRYLDEILRQMDLIGVGSLPICLLTGFFTGGVLVLQTFPTLQYYGIHNETGRSVAVSLIRELGPVLTALMVSGRIGSAISAELGSMVVSQQIDAMHRVKPCAKVDEFVGFCLQVNASDVVVIVIVNNECFIFITTDQMRLLIGHQ